MLQQEIIMGCSRAKAGISGFEAGIPVYLTLNASAAIIRQNQSAAIFS